MPVRQNQEKGKAASGRRADTGRTGSGISKENQMTKIVKTDKAPAAIGPYSQGVIAGGFLYTSGQIAIDPATQKVVEGDIKVQARRVMENLCAILKEAGYETKDVVKTVCFLKNMSDFAAFNGIYGEYFKADAPARSCVAVASLPKDVLVEVEVIAYKG